MDIYGFAQDPARRKRWDALLRDLERVRDGYGKEMVGRLGMCFAAMHGILASVCAIARLQGKGVTAVLSFSPPSDDTGTDGRLAITLVGGPL